MAIYNQSDLYCSNSIAAGGREVEIRTFAFHLRASDRLWKNVGDRHTVGAYGRLNNATGAEQCNFSSSQWLAKET